MASYHNATFDLLGAPLSASITARGEVEIAEGRLGMRLPNAVREWYSYEDAISILAKHSNADPPIPVAQFSQRESKTGRLLPIRWENQGVCTWAVLLDGSDDPPVYVDVDSNGEEWQRCASSFSTYVYTCIWDHRLVFRQAGLVQAQNRPISSQTLERLATALDEQPRTLGWPGSTQFRFTGPGYGVLIWSTKDRSADWFLGAVDAESLTSALRFVWELDGVGASFYECSDVGKEVLASLGPAD